MHNIFGRNKSVKLRCYIYLLETIQRLLRTQQGCRTLQRIIQDDVLVAIPFVFKAIIEDINEIASGKEVFILNLDQYGNYVVQKLVENCSWSQTLVLLERFEISKLLKTVHGSYVIFSMIKSLQKNRIFQGNHVINDRLKAIFSLIISDIDNVNVSHLVQQSLVTFPSHNLQVCLFPINTFYSSSCTISFVIILKVYQCIEMVVA